jgi:hypothetical protein
MVLDWFSFDLRRSLEKDEEGIIFLYQRRTATQRSKELAKMKG